MDVLARLAGPPRPTGLARLLYKLYVFSSLRLHDSAQLAGPARFAEIPAIATGLARLAGTKKRPICPCNRILPELSRQSGLKNHTRTVLMLQM